MLQRIRMTRVAIRSTNAASNGESTDPWAVPDSDVDSSTPSNTPTCKHFPMSRKSDPSATDVDAISSTASAPG